MTLKTGVMAAEKKSALYHIINHARSMEKLIMHNIRFFTVFCPYKGRPRVLETYY